MKTDDYGEVLNDPETYDGIAEGLRQGLSVFVGWTDGHMSHFDILFTKRPLGVGHFQRGIHTSDLFVSIMGIGAFGFEIENEDTHWGYIDGKFDNFFGPTTGPIVATLINEVKKRLYG